MDMIYIILSIDSLMEIKNWYPKLLRTWADVYTWISTDLCHPQQKPSTQKNRAHPASNLSATALEISQIINHHHSTHLSPLFWVSQYLSVLLLQDCLCSCNTICLLGLLYNRSWYSVYFCMHHYTFLINNTRALQAYLTSGERMWEERSRWWRQYSSLRLFINLLNLHNEQRDGSL
jgi:hypothetical protein